MWNEVDIDVLGGPAQLDVVKRDETCRLSWKANALRGYVHGPTESIFP